MQWLHSAATDQKEPEKPESGLLLGLTPALKENPDLLLLAQHIHSEPFLLTSERYEKLGWTVYRGNITKSLLLRYGLIREHEIQVTKSSRGKLLSLTQKGRDALFNAGYTQARLAQHGSLVHEFWKRKCYQLFIQRGWRCELEQNQVDLVCTRGSERLHVEVETGKSDVVRNVQKSIDSKARVLSLCVGKKAYAIVKKKLAEAGLLNPGKVEIQLVQNLF